MPTTKTLFTGKYLQVLQDGKWEYAARVKGTAVVAIAAKYEGKLIVTEQFRRPVNCRVIDLPAGLVGDTGDVNSDSPRLAAERELLEETGFVADNWANRITIPTSPGLTSETVQIFVAEGLRRESEGGGIGREEITVHLIPIVEMKKFLVTEQTAGKFIDSKVFIALHLLEHDEE
ncbi:MAG: NUDIX hydrolase [Planctomycetaceae bacterium]|nr:NUDIX hydrolase [Planctomycetaceae bacterium]